MEALAKAKFGVVSQVQQRSSYDRQTHNLRNRRASSIKGSFLAISAASARNSCSRSGSLGPLAKMQDCQGQPVERIEAHMKYSRRDAREQVWELKTKVLLQLRLKLRIQVTEPVRLAF